MKPVLAQNLIHVGLLVCAFGMSGCVISVGSKVNTQPPPPPAVLVTDPGDAATIAEIDAAARLNLDSSKTQALSQIADRPNVPPPVQVHLINTAYRCLNMESSKVQVLQKMIARPDFGDATRHAIVSQLGLLGFESNKQDLLNRINQRLAPAR